MSLTWVTQSGVPKRVEVMKQFSACGSIALIGFRVHRPVRLNLIPAEKLVRFGGLVDHLRWDAADSGCFNAVLLERFVLPILDFVAVSNGALRDRKVVSETRNGRQLTCKHTCPMADGK